MMFKKYSLFTCIALMIGFLSVGGPAAAQIRLVTENYPPFNYQDENGEVTGVSTEIVRELMKRAGIEYSLTVLPWKRAYLQALSELDTCVYSTAETEEREKLFHWVGPIIENDWVLFAKKGRFDKQMTLDQAKAFRIGGYPGDAITQFLLSEGVDVEVTGKDESNLKKLMVDRIDLWPSGLVIGRHVARSEGHEIEPVVTLKSVRVSLACNRNMGMVAVTLLRNHLKKMADDGTLARIKAAYGGLQKTDTSGGEG
ncbi:substrate-binding periplasmic protein [Aestuariispira insulae]|uniref:Amino acid ABC transporter substrate-binding protein (PAAT family) n=1 Tax=Aestuariispira insulae TaxID=1461337 RepID=A0A3D9HSP8_9PROT|nr:transporter substrate-binding domain-containing protein [Aestuariispira insulae]RED52371.1 amino acid ABC transporter substrate-binding protein (PAAT family) [Aestuariispira insulae]